MKKILVPTDFSKAAANAAQYAAWLAQKLSAKMELVHVIDIGTPGTKLHNWQKLEAQMIKSGQEGAKQVMENIRNPVEITYKHLAGSPFQDVVSEFAESEKADMIVIGSRGASGLKKALFGSNAATLINRCSKPVIVVPAEAEFNGIRKVLYPTDMVHLDEEIKTIARFAKHFDAQILVLHVKSGNAPKRDTTNLENILTRMANYRKIKFDVVGNEDVVAGIEEYVQSEKPDLLAMFTHELDLYERIFGKSVTRQVTFHNSLPLLSINRDKSRE